MQISRKRLEAKQREAIWEGRDQSAVWTSLDERDNSRNSESTSSFQRIFPDLCVHADVRVNERSDQDKGWLGIRRRSTPVCLHSYVQFFGIALLCWTWKEAISLGETWRMWLPRILWTGQAMLPRCFTWKQNRGFKPVMMGDLGPAKARCS